MQIPKSSIKSRPVYHKQCKESGCKVMFTGIGVTKYCDEHRDPKNRYKTKEIISDHSKNIYLHHSFTDDQLVERQCNFCSNIYRFKLEPKLYLYPGCCEACRSRPQEELNVKRSNSKIV